MGVVGMEDGKRSSRLGEELDEVHEAGGDNPGCECDVGVPAGESDKGGGGVRVMLT